MGGGTLGAPSATAWANTLRVTVLVTFSNANRRSIFQGMALSTSTPSLRLRRVDGRKRESLYHVTMSLPSRFARARVISNVCGWIRSSESTKLMYSPAAAASPALRASERPPLGLLMILKRGSRLAYSRRMAGLSSVLPSSTHRASQSRYVWFAMLSRQRRR